MSAAKKDLTLVVQRFGKLEKHVGVKFQGIMAFVDETGNWLTVNGELLLKKNRDNENVRIICSAHDAEGRVLGTVTQAYEWENLYDFQVFCLFVQLATPDVVSVKLYPQTF